MTQTSHLGDAKYLIGQIPASNKMTAATAKTRRLLAYPTGKFTEDYFKPSHFIHDSGNSHFTVSEMAEPCVTAPQAALTVIVYVPFGVPGFALPAPPLP